MNTRIYLDNNATTPLDPEVKTTILSLLDLYGNSSSLHEEGRSAKAALNAARATLAEKLKVKPQEIIFTSGGTESMNTLITGVLQSQSSGHIITSNVEHACVQETVKRLETRGFDVTYLSPGNYGAVTPQQVADALRPNTKLIVLMAANNETGVITDVASIARLASEKHILFVVDAVCAFGKMPLSIVEGISGMGFSAHKFHAPKGVGFMYLRSGVPFAPLLVGGEQEQGKRGGTVPVPLIGAMEKAVQLLNDAHIDHMKTLRDLFELQLMEQLPGVRINGEGPRLCNTSHLYFEGVEGELLLQKLDLKGLACSHGSACSSGALEPSKVLLGMGYTRKQAGSSVRFSFSRMNTREEVFQAVEWIKLLIASQSRSIPPSRG